MAQAYLASRLPGSEHMAETPEGYLLCLNSILARTATRVPQKYSGEEVGAPEEKEVDVYRAPEEVFSERHFASLKGKIVTDDHPPEFLTPDNTSWYSKGHVLNVRRGPKLANGEDSIVGDLLITDPTLKAKIKQGAKRGLSVGYVP